MDTCSECDLWGCWAVLGSAPEVSEAQGDGEGFTEEGEEEAGGREGHRDQGASNQRNLDRLQGGRGGECGQCPLNLATWELWMTSGGEGEALVVVWAGAASDGLQSPGVKGQLVELLHEVRL